MALNKRNLNINFAQGVETNSDPFQLEPGKFLRLVNTIFNPIGRLEKRNGFAQLPVIPDLTCRSLSTFRDGLIGIGNTIQSFSSNTQQWYNQGNFQPLKLSVTPAARSANPQSGCDVAVAPNGLACTVLVDSVNGAQYQIFDSTTGQTVVTLTNLPTTASLPRVFINGTNFIITYLAGANPYGLFYISIPMNKPKSPSTPADATAGTVKTLAGGYDGYVSNGSLYLAWNATDSGGAIRGAYLDTTLVLHTFGAVVTGKSALILSLTADVSGTSPVIWVSFADTTTGYAQAFSPIFVAIGTTTTILSSSTPVQITSAATGGVNTVLFQIQANMPYSIQQYVPSTTTAGTYSSISYRSDTIQMVGVNSAGTISPALADVIYGFGIGSKAFLMNGNICFLGSYQSFFQSSYFLFTINSATFPLAKPVAKLAYSNGGGYATSQVLSNVTINSNVVQFSYLFQDSIAAISTAAAQSTSITNSSGSQVPVGGVYTQLGVNLATVQYGGVPIKTAELGAGLHLTGGFLWHYDGVAPYEHNFNLYPDKLGWATATTGGSMIAQTYYYCVVYEWTDAQGMVHRSAPSIPLSAIVPSGTSTNTVTVNIPTYQPTYKTGKNPVRVVIYRWATDQQSYYRVTSITSPKLNDPTSKSLSFTDTVASSSIVGNDLLYTTGGVVENIAAPACSDLTIFKSRLMVLSSEDPNQVWYSKQVIEATPVENSDTFTLYEAPTTGSQGSTGSVTALSVMDDKLITFRKNAIYYQTGTGPDNTGANNDFSDPLFITATVGSTNNQSITTEPSGLQFQSDKGIWLLGRDLLARYIGSPVEAFNEDTVVAALGVPGTNQIRFTFDNDLTIMYDYFYQQWGTFEGIPAVSSVVYQSLHTFVNSLGQVFQESPGVYLDGSRPVTWSFTTSWFNLAGLQGYQRAYYFFMLGTYVSPHKLAVSIAYDYNPAASQSLVISPNNYSGFFGTDTTYGTSRFFGGVSPKEQWRVFFEQQKCQSFQISMSEIYDSSFGVAAGAGVYISGLNLVFGAKKGWPRVAASNSTG